MSFVAVDLSRLPAPTVVEPLDFEIIFNAMLLDLRALDAQFTTISEADPAYKILQVAAYRELMLRQRVNDAARATMLAYAAGSDLDHIVAREPYNIERLLIDAGDATAIPPIAATWESDDDLRRRAQLAPERYSTAGPEGAYIFHALRADAQVLDASVTSPAPGQAVVTILARSANGIAAPALLEKVNLALSAKEVRPLTDAVITQSASIIDYEIIADLTLYEGPDEALVLATAQQRVEEYCTRMHRLGLDVALSGIDGALHCAGVMKVHRVSPAAEITVSRTQASYCTSIAITVSGRAE